MVDAMATLSVAECRKYLKDTNLTDKQIETIRDNLTITTNTIFDKVLQNANNKSGMLYQSIQRQTSQ